MKNLYFDLTEELNAEGPIAVLASGDPPYTHGVFVLFESLPAPDRRSAPAFERS